MEKRDFIKDELERIGRAISQLLANFLGLKADGNIELGVEATNKQLKDELDIDVELMLTLEQQQLAKYLENRKLTPQHIETLIDYFFETGDSLKAINVNKTKNLLNKSLEMADLLDKNSKTYSLERKEKEHQIREFVKSLPKD